MSHSQTFWQIVATDEYIDQVCQLDIRIQNNIQEQWIEVSKHEDPRDLGQWDDCGADDEDCPFIVVIFPGLEFEFMYEIDRDDQKLTLVDCHPLDIHHPNDTQI